MRDEATVMVQGMCVAGRAAALILLIVAHAERINALAVGRVVFNVAYRQIHPVIEESLPPTHLPAT